MNSGLPSDDNSSAIPKVLKWRCNALMRPDAPSEASSHMGQLLYLSTRTKKVIPFVVKVVCTDALERIYRRHQWGWWSGWLGRGHAIACIAAVSLVVDVNCDAGPEH